MSFANYGGGYILIGVDKDNHTVIDVENELDPSTIAEIIEKNAGIHLKFDIAYFLHDFGRGSCRVGLIYIHPSKEVLACTKDLTSEDGRTIIIRENDVYTRRNTRSIKASPNQIEEIIY